MPEKNEEQFVAVISKFYRLEVANDRAQRGKPCACDDELWFSSVCVCVCAFKVDDEFAEDDPLTSAFKNNISSFATGCMGCWLNDCVLFKVKKRNQQQLS